MYPPALTDPLNRRPVRTFVIRPMSEMRYFPSYPTTSRHSSSLTVLLLVGGEYTRGAVEGLQNRQSREVGHQNRAAATGISGLARWVFPAIEQDSTAAEPPSRAGTGTG